MSRESLVRVGAALLGVSLPEAKPETSKRAPRALIVEDDQTDAEDIAHLLRTEGWEAVINESPEQGLATLRAKKFEALFLDIHFAGPHMDGYEMERRMLRDQTIENVPVIFVTGAIKILGEMKPGRCFTHIVKPTTLEAIRVALKKCNGVKSHPEPIPQPQLPVAAATLCMGGLLFLAGIGTAQGWLKTLIQFFLK